MELRDDLLVPYWLRTVRIGLVVTLLVLVGLTIPPFLPEHADYRSVGYFVVLVMAALGALVIRSLPWKELFRRGIGLRFLYGWSAADILLITFAVALTGGGRSELFVMYALTTVFFGASYPQRGQAALLAFTFACYLTVLAITGWELSALSLFIRLTTLAILALLTSFLARELMRQMTAHETARSNAERWASLLSTVARAAQSMPLDRERVVDVALDAILEMGFDGAALTALDEEGSTYRVIQARGLPESYSKGVYPKSTGVTGRVFSEGQTVVFDDYSARPEAVPTVRDAGFRAVMASPIWVQGWLAGVLIGGCREKRRLLPQEVDAFELLATQTALSLENVHRYEEELEAVGRLEELDRLKSDFLATVSHELRTPVTVIEGIGLTLEQAWTRLDDPTRDEMLAGLSANARSLDAIITSLLDFSRLETGHLDVNFGVLHASDLLRHTAGRLSGLFSDHRLVVEVEPNLVASADAILIDRAVENLLSNAAKHTPAGTTVTLSAQAEDGEVEVAVADDGPGISEDEVQHLGERFFRGGDVNTRKRGIGLGLALVREMLELHRTELRVETEVGTGSRFSFRLPAVSPEEWEPEQSGFGQDGSDQNGADQNGPEQDGPEIGGSDRTVRAP